MPDKIAVVIPTFSSNQTRCAIAAKTAASWKDQCDDLILTEDSAYCYDLHVLADLYLLHDQLWPAANMNLGWQIALSRGADYVAIMDMDAYWVSGDLREACIPGKVVVPSIVQHPETVTVAPMLIVPKEVAAERGFYYADKFPRLQSFDADYHVRVGDILVQSRQLKVFHEGGCVTGNIPYEHPDWAKQRERAAGGPVKEVDPARHKQRLEEDPEYKAKYDIIKLSE